MKGFSSCVVLSRNDTNFRVYFGDYPTKEQISIMTKRNINIIVNLCTKSEISIKPKIVVPSGLELIDIPIIDGTSNKSQMVDSNALMLLVRRIERMVNKDPTAIYIFDVGCGRSAMFTAILIGKLTSNDSETMIKIVEGAYMSRSDLKPKWKFARAFHNTKQKEIVKSWLS